MSNGIKTISESKNMPIYKARVGTVKTAVWKKTTEKGDMYSVSLSKSYKNKESGEWKESKVYLNMNELLNAAELLRSTFNAMKVIAE